MSIGQEAHLGRTSFEAAAADPRQTPSPAARLPQVRQKKGAPSGGIGALGVGEPGCAFSVPPWRWAGRRHEPSGDSLSAPPEDLRPRAKNRFGSVDVQPHRFTATGYSEPRTYVHHWCSTTDQNEAAGADLDLSEVVRASVRSAKPNVRAFARRPCRRPPALRTRAVQAAYEARC